MVEAQKSSLRGEALREKVLDTALKLFSERGYFNTSVHDIRRAAGVSTGAIYHHFHNKEALALSLYESLLQQMDEVISSVCQQKSGCLEKSAAIIEALFSLATEQPRQMQFILLAQHREYLRDQAPICSSRPFQAMRGVIVEGIEAGEVRAVDPWVAASTMYGGALRMMNLQLDGALERPLSEYLDEIVECGWRGIKV